MEKKRHIFRMADYEVGDRVKIFTIGRCILAQSSVINEIRIRGNVIRVIVNADPELFMSDKMEFIGDRRAPCLSNEYYTIAIPSYEEEIKLMYKKTKTYDSLRDAVILLKEVWKNINEDE